MQRSNTWDKKARHTVTKIKNLLTNLSIQVRTDQFKIFFNNLSPNKHSKALDVGVTSDEVLKDSNIFERLYPYSERLTVATIEDNKKFAQMYPKLKKVVKIYPGNKLPFKDHQFDIVTSWAVLEHVGGYKNQAKFLNELLRVGKSVFITTPYRGCVYEPHTGLPIVQWLPLYWFRKICKLLNMDFWSNESNLNPLFVRDIKKMKLIKKLNIKIYNMFGILPSHIILTN